MDRLERFYRIDQLLKERRATPFATLQSALGVSRATLKRDLEYMRERFNAPIEFDREAGGYKFGAHRAGPRYELPGLWFSAEEAYALLTLQRLLAGLEPGLLGAQAQPLAERLRAVVGAGRHDWKDVEERIRILQPGRRGAALPFFGLVAQALLARKRLGIVHWNRVTDTETARTVSPQRLVHYRDNWYLDAYCHLREDLRSFSLDAIRAATLREERAKEIGRAPLDAYLKSGYGIFAGREVQWARLRFSAVAARWVSAQTWHSSQRTRLDADGSLVLELPYADDRELAMEIQRYGPEVEVLGPPALRKAVAASLEKAAARYR